MQTVEIYAQNKVSLPWVAAVCPSDPSVPTGPSLVFSLTTTDIEVVIQQFLSRTFTALSVTSGKQPWFFNTSCYNHMTPNKSQFFDKATLEHPITIYTADELLCLLVIKEQSLLLVYPLVTPFISQSYPSICFLLVNFVN